MITDIINFDPSSIVVTRHTKVPHAGGFTWNTSTLPVQTVRIYFITPRNQREITIPEGEVKTIVMAVLAEPTADFKCDHLVFDTFIFQGREFRIVGVRHYTDVNIDAQCQCDAVAA